MYKLYAHVFVVIVLYDGLVIHAVWTSLFSMHCGLYIWFYYHSFVIKTVNIDDVGFASYFIEILSYPSRTIIPDTFNKNV